MSETTSSSKKNDNNEDGENKILDEKLSNSNENDDSIKNDGESKQQQPEKLITGINGDLDRKVVGDNKKKKKKNRNKTGSMDVTTPTPINDSSSNLEPSISTTKTPITTSELKAISEKTQKDLNELEKNQKKMESMRRTLDMLKLKSATIGLSNNLNQPPKSREDALEKKYEFWETQPVPKLTESDEIVKDKNEPIHPPMQPEEIPQDSLKLPDGFQWVSLNIDQDEEELKELYTLLYENYVEDDDNMFRFNYSPEFLRWVLQPPGWRTDWYAGVRVQKSDGKKGKLVGFISAIPTKIRVYDKELDTVEINFLCVHKKLRSKRMAPVLISEITRRVRLQGIFQALYTAGVFLPKPIASCRYYHRSLNPKKLIDVGFSHLTRNMTMSRTIKLYRVPEQTSLEGLRPMKREDVEQVHQLLTEHMKNFDLVPLFTLEEIAHWLLPIKNVIETYVVENKQMKKIVGFFSYYILPSTVMNHKQYKDIRAAYSFYNVPSEHCSLEQLMSDALIIAKNADLDVFNALDQRDNEQFLAKLKFGRGDGDLHYYLFNWKCPPMKSEKVGVVLQ